MAWKSDDKKKKVTTELEDCAISIALKANTGIHDDLENSSDKLERHELKTYIDGKGLDVDAIQRDVDKDRLTVSDVLEIGIHFARFNTHKNWHSLIKDMAKKYGVDLPDMEGVDIETSVKVVGSFEDLPEEIRDEITKQMNKLNKKKKGKK